MSMKDPRIDAYIKNSAEFARPILNHLRDLVHQGCPEVEETLKWRMPSFTYKGLLCGMAAFKQHATFGFWKHELVVGKTAENEGMGQFGRLTSLKDLPSDKVLLGYIRKAAALNDAGIKAPSRVRAKPGEQRELAVPGYLAAALKKDKMAKTNFDNFSYSHKKEYVDWINEAKREETRDQRMATAIEWMAKGKPRHWKYLNC